MSFFLKTKVEQLIPNLKIFFFDIFRKVLNKKNITIVTHHWSTNINKGYETYFKLWKYLKNIQNISN